MPLKDLIVYVCVIIDPCLLGQHSNHISLCVHMKRGTTPNNMTRIITLVFGKKIDRYRSYRIEKKINCEINPHASSLSFSTRVKWLQKGTDCVLVNFSLKENPRKSRKSSMRINGSKRNSRETRSFNNSIRLSSEHNSFVSHFPRRSAPGKSITGLILS